MKLAYRVTDLVHADVNVDPPRYLSSVFRHFQEAQQVVDESQVADLARLREVDPAGDVEFVEVG